MAVGRRYIESSLTTALNRNPMEGKSKAWNLANQLLQGVASMAAALAVLIFSGLFAMVVINHFWPYYSMFAVPALWILTAAPLMFLIIKAPWQARALVALLFGVSLFFFSPHPLCAAETSHKTEDC